MQIFQSVDLTIVNHLFSCDNILGGKVQLENKRAILATLPPDLLIRNATTEVAGGKR